MIIRIKLQLPNSYLLNFTRLSLQSFWSIYLKHCPYIT